MLTPFRRMCVTQSLQVDEDSVNALVKQLRREAKNNAEAVQTMLLDCAVQLCGKAPLYALLVGTRRCLCVMPEVPCTSRI